MLAAEDVAHTLRVQETASNEAGAGTPAGSAATAVVSQAPPVNISYGLAAALLMLIFLLSLAGIPPTAGFIGKYYLFAAVIESGHYSLAVIAVLNAAISLYFYLRIVVSMFMRDATEKSGIVLLSPGLMTAMALAFIFTIWIGIYPDPFISIAQRAVLAGF